MICFNNRDSRVPGYRSQSVPEGRAEFHQKAFPDFCPLRFHQCSGLGSPLSLLNQRHEVIAVRLHDPAEIALPDVGIMVMEDAETGEQLYVDTHDKKFRERFHSAMQQREDELKRSFKRAGVDMLSISTEDDMVRSIVRFVQQRQQLRRVH